jgi:hypothetical protein
MVIRASELGGDVVEVTLRERPEVGAAGEVLAQQTVFSLLPRCQGLWGSQK